MIVKCILDREDSISKEELALAPAWRRDGSLSASVGKHYIVYAMRRNEESGAKWYLVYSDYRHLWWMPASAYETVDGKRPQGWTDKSTREDIFSSYPSLHQWKLEEGIIDSEGEAEQVYLAEVKNDPTFPTQQELNRLNYEIDKQQRVKKYNEELEMAKANGWERPEKPEDID